MRLLDRLAELGEIFHAELLGEGVVDSRLLGNRDLFHLDLELRLLAGERGHRIGLGESCLDDALIARLGTDQAFLEARNKSALTDDDRRILGLAALERFAVDLAEEVDGDAVARLGAAALGRLIGEIAVDQPLHCLFDISVADGGDRPLDLDRPQIGQCNLGQHFEIHGEGQIGLAADHLLDLFLVLGEFDLGLEGGALFTRLERLTAAFGDGALHHFGHQRAAIHLLQMRGWHLAGPEALELDAVLDLVDPLGEQLPELAAIDDDLKLPLQTFVTRFCNLHRVPALISTRRVAGSRQKPLRNSAAGSRLVRAEGLEPPRPKPPEPKSGVSANSTTPAELAARLASGVYIMAFGSGASRLPRPVTG